MTRSLQDLHLAYLTAEYGPAKTLELAAERKSVAEALAAEFDSGVRMRAESLLAGSDRKTVIHWLEKVNRHIQVGSLAEREIKGVIGYLSECRWQSKSDPFQDIRDWDKMQTSGSQETEGRQ